MSAKLSIANVFKSMVISFCIGFPNTKLIKLATIKLTKQRTVKHTLNEVQQAEIGVSAAASSSVKFIVSKSAFLLSSVVQALA